MLQWFRIPLAVAVFDSQNLNDSSQLCITSVLGDWCPLLTSMVPHKHTHTRYTYIHAKNLFTRVWINRWIHVYIYMPWHACRDQTATCKSQFSLSTMCDYRVELRSSVFVGHRTIWITNTQVFWWQLIILKTEWLNHTNLYYISVEKMSCVK